MKKSIFLFFAAILCATSAWAGPTFSGGYVYFHNKGGWNDANKQLCIGKGTSGNSSYTSTYTMAAVKNTQLWYDDLPTSGWGDATYMAVIGNSSSWGPGNWGTDNLKNATHRTKSASLGNWGFSKNHYQMLTPDNGNNDATLTLTWVGDNISAMNKTITVKAKVSTDKGATYAEKTSPGTLEASSFKFTDYKTCTTTTSLSSGKITCGYTANTTLTAAEADGYTFAGWYDASGNKQTEELTLSLNPTADATYYAYYKANQYNINYKDQGDGAFSGTHTTGAPTKHTYGIATTLTTASKVGYTFEGWHTDAACTNKVTSLDATAYTSDITLYAQWAEIPANIHNISYNNGTGWTYGAKPTSAEEGTTVTFVVNPTTGYTVSVTSDDVTLNKNENEYTFTMPTKDVAINVSATENTHSVSVSYKCGDETIKATATVDAVGEATSTSVTAPEIDGYVFTSWTLGSGIQSANTTANPISITTQASGDYILTANYTKMVTVYLINNSNWAKVYAYGWKNGEAQGTPAWPGAEITANKLAEKYEGYDVYSYKVKEGSYDNVIFNNNSGKQTETFAWTDGTYYYAVDPLGSNVYLAGEMTNWGTDKVEFKKTTAEATTASVTVNLTAKSYTFKLVRGEDWFGNYGTMQRGGDGVHEGGWSFDETAYEANCTIVADYPGDYTFTWNLETKKLTVTYPELPTYTVTATAENGTVTGAGEYKHGTEATLVATPNTGYAFVNWKKGEEVVSSEASYTFTVTANTDLVATFAPEVTHEVTVSYICNSNPIPGHDATTLAVGVTTPSTITAPAITNYAFVNWTVGDGVQAVDANANPIQITTKAEGEYTLVANYTKIELTYTVKVPEGTEKCYIAGDMNSWSFQEMTPTANANEFTITIDGATTAHKYKYTCGEGWAFVEKKADGSELDADRTYNANDVVAKWAEPAKCYLMGIGGDWTTGIEMEEDGDQFKLLCQPIAEGEQFKFKYGETWTTDVENYDANGVAWVESYPGSGQYNITLPAGNYDFYYKKNENKVWIEVCTPATPTLVTPTVVENAYFSVGNNKYVQFSTGNLQYEVGTNTWSFASEQYEVIGGDAYDPANPTNTNYGMNEPGYTGKLDLFGWSSDGNFGVNPSNTDADYGTDGVNDFVDWGTLVNETGWYTLTKDEMNYILNRKKDGKKLWALATVCGMNGLILLPDNWNTSTTLEYGYVPADFKYTQNQLDDAAWAALEAAGAVFLPEGGTRVGGHDNKEQGGGPAEFDAHGDYFHVDNVGEMGYYWLNTQDSRDTHKNCASFLILPGWSEGPTDADNDDVAHSPQVWSREKRRGNSVRLVKAVEPDYTRSVIAGNFGTICLPFGATNYTGMELYEFVGKEAGKVYIASVTNLEAGVPYIFLASASEIAVYSDGTTAATPGSHNGLVGTFTDETVVANGNYILKSNELRVSDGNAKVNANRAYIVMGDVPADKPQPMPGRRYIGMDVQGENAATGLDNITNGENTTIKVIENGQLIIIRNGEKFNAQGVRF